MIRILILTLLISFPVHPVEVGKCYYNISDYESLFIIKSNRKEIVSTYYTQSGRIYELFKVPLSKLNREGGFRLYKYECPRFTMIHSVTIERIKNSGMEESFILAVCRSRTINRARNLDLCVEWENK